MIQPKATNRDEFIAECKSGALDGISVVYRTFDSVKITGKIDSELLDAFPKSIKFLCHNGENTLLSLYPIASLDLYSRNIMNNAK